MIELQDDLEEVEMQNQTMSEQMVINGDESEIKSKELIAFKRLNEQLEEKLYSKKIELVKKEYPNKKAAKMWYDILVDGIKKYSIEIRWKGNVFCSPQIIIQKINISFS